MAVRDIHQPTTEVSIETVRQNLGISQERLAKVLDVSAKTVHRWEAKDQLPSNRWVLQVVQDLQGIAELGLIVFTPDGFHRLMTAPQPGLGNRSGLALVEEGRADEVLGLLASTYEGGLGE